MELTILGTSGSQPIPLPTCDCALCAEAREEGAPYARTGTALYLHDANALIDASEFAPYNLNRWAVPALDHLLLTHWHPDHSGGLRVLAMRAPDQREGETFVDAKRRTAPTVVTTPTVYERAREQVPTLGFFVEERGFADRRLVDGDPLAVDGLRIEAIPYPLSAEGPADATAFVLRDDDAALAVVADDSRHLDVDLLPDDLDCLVHECGHFTHGPGGERIRAADLETDDLSHGEVLDRVGRIDADRTLLTHLGHHYRRGYDDYRALERGYDGVEFAYDGQAVTV